MIVRCIRSRGTPLTYQALYEVRSHGTTAYEIAGFGWFDKDRFEVLPPVFEKPWLWSALR